MRSGILVASLLLMAVIVAPAGAFTTDNLLIAVDEDGSASITINYTLSWIETIAVFFKIADPAQELKSALEGSLGVPVTVTSAESDSAAFSVREFAEIEGADGGRVYSTPGLDFTGAQEVIDSMGMGQWLIAIGCGLVFLGLYLWGMYDAWRQAQSETEQALGAELERLGALVEPAVRSEEPSVGKECRSRWSP